ncbi:STAS domain-containing protein [Nocardioides sp. REDSEA-S30_B4]|jgi:anti-anti-sigma factor|uniref:STAS domain-containing protein n=1 Tax=Nocardioides sp. REDSEA-S30_B4 TaxID=1811552 RepID=UPI000A4DBBBB|nr:STAS domain-containing protein [Nocardioides sp. REDSEA-S30_B4]MAY96033.1 anti-anti-sigma factor [Nocardioides sp.]
MDITTDGPTLVLSGDLDGRSTTRVRAALYDHLAEHPHVVADMSGVDSVDLTALRVLAMASRAAAREGHHLTLRGCGPAVRRMLHLSHLIRVVDVEREPARA